MSISFIGSATGTTSVVLPAHIAGDLIALWAFTDGTATIATNPRNQWRTGAAANSCAGVIGWKIATSNAETSGTWTNATRMLAVVYRGTNALSLGGVVLTTGVSATVSYSAVTMQNPYGTSWVAAFVGHRSTDTTLSTHPPTGMSLRVSSSTTSDMAAFDTGGVVSSQALFSVASGGTTSGSVTAYLEIIEDDPTVAGIACTTAAIVSGTNTVVIDKPFNCQVGDTLAYIGVIGCSTTGAESLPAGWSVPTNGKVAWDATSLSSLFAATRVVDGTEGATFSFASTTAGTQFGAQGILHRITGTDKASPVDVAANQRTQSTTTGTFPSVTTTRDNDLVIYAGLLNQAAAAANFNVIGPTGVGLSGYANDNTVPNAVSTGSLVAGAAGAVGTKTVAVPTLGAATDFKAITVSFKKVNRYILTAASGGYTLAGAALALKRSRIMPAATEAYTLAGSAPAMSRARPIAAGAGTYTLTGAPLSLLRTRLMPAASATYTLGGTTLGLTHSRPMAAASVAYALSGAALALTVNHKLAAATTSYALGGTAAALRRNRNLAAASSAYVLAGTATALRQARRLAATTTAYALGGTIVSLRRARRLIAATRSYALGGTAVTLTYTKITPTLTAGPGHYALTGSDALLRLSNWYGDPHRLTWAGGGEAGGWAGSGHAGGWTGAGDTGGWAGASKSATWG